MMRLFAIFFRIGIFGFGGLGSVLALIERDLVDKRNLLSKDEITEALTYTKMLPGSTVVQIVGYLGWRLGGWSGSAAATIGFVAPAFFVMLALSALYLQVSGLPGIQGALRGLNAAVIGLLVITAYNLGRSAIKDLPGLFLAATALILAAFAQVPLALIVVGAGLLGIANYAAQRRREKSEEKAKDDLP
jgi:chromate transporter